MQRASTLYKWWLRKRRHNDWCGSNVNEWRFLCIIFAFWFWEMAGNDAVEENKNFWHIFSVCECYGGWWGDHCENPQPYCEGIELGLCPCEWSQIQLDLIVILDVSEGSFPNNSFTRTHQEVANFIQLCIFCSAAQSKLVLKAGNTQWQLWNIRMRQE